MTWCLAFPAQQVMLVAVNSLWDVRLRKRRVRTCVHVACFIQSKYTVTRVL